LAAAAWFDSQRRGHVALLAGVATLAAIIVAASVFLTHFGHG
jgi:hypothetical protein